MVEANHRLGRHSGFQSPVDFPHIFVFLVVLLPVITGTLMDGTINVTEVCLTPQVNNAAQETFCMQKEATEVTLTGYVVDNFCWDMEGHVGFDGSLLGTAPETHWLHCLLLDTQAAPCISNGSGGKNLFAYKQTASLSTARTLAKNQSSGASKDTRKRYRNPPTSGCFRGTFAPLEQVSCSSRS